MILDRLPTDRLPVSNRPHVGEAGIDGQSTGAPCAALVDDHHMLVYPLNDPLRFDAEVVKAF